MRIILALALTLGPLVAQSSDKPPVLRRKTPPPAEETKPETENAPPAASKEAKPPETEPEEDANYPRTQRPVKSSADAKDPGAPKLKRGAPAPRPKSSAPQEPDPELEPMNLPTATTAAKPTPPSPKPAQPSPQDPAIRETVTDAEGSVEKVVDRRPLDLDDPLILKAQEAAFEFTEKLPNFICDQLTLRSVSKTLNPDWKLQDRIELELIYVGGKEDYRNIKLNGKALKKGSPMDSGTWSTGEFGTILADIYSPGTNANFKLRGNSNAAGLRAKVYDFKVAQPNSHWQIRIGRTVKPSYKGAVWIEEATGRTLRIEMDTRTLPADYDVDKVETIVDYGWVTISGQRYLLPTKSANLACYRGTFTCTMNEIEFRNYRKFSAESQILQTDSEISFPEADDPKKPASKTVPPSITEPTLKKN